ncbi:MAG: C39 family peptidase [bacterium]|nr:C39 family peptidase [bacterium]
MAKRRQKELYKNPKKIIVFGFVSLFVVVGFTVLLWNPIHQFVLGRTKANLPKATSFGEQFVPPANSNSNSDQSGDVLVPFEGGISKSENYVLETAPQKKPPSATDPLAYAGALPNSVNLDVPFTSQAPNADWSLPYQEACEEASAIMVDGYYKGMSGKIDPAEADRKIQSLTLYEKSSYGFYEDTTAEETARFIRDYFGYTDVLVRPFSSVEDLKRPLALGYPVMIPSAGQLLGNPNFSGDGPPYHMIVLRGYTQNVFITNDPGTRRGESYTYSYDTILKSAHDWTGDKNTVQQGARVMIVILPNK